MLADDVTELVSGVQLDRVRDALEAKPKSGPLANSVAGERH